MSGYECSLKIYSNDLPIDSITGEKKKAYYIFEQRNLNKNNSCPFYNKVKKSGSFFDRQYKVEVSNYQKFLKKITQKSKGFFCKDCVCFEDYSGSGYPS